MSILFTQNQEDVLLGVHYILRTNRLCSVFFDCNASLQILRSVAEMQKNRTNLTCDMSLLLFEKVRHCVMMETWSFSVTS